VKPSHLWIAGGIALGAGVLYVLNAGTISALQLVTIAPKLRTRPDLVAAHLPHINAALPAIGGGPKTRAMFLAQALMETDQLLGVTEYASGWDYDPSVNPSLAKKLGNVGVGSGPKYRGRGVPHCTGAFNYGEAGKALGLPLLEQPDLAALPENAWRIGVWYWRKHNLTPLAEAGDLLAVTKKINGGTNGIDARQAFLARALPALGVPA
jgi:putative chitinase